MNKQRGVFLPSIVQPRFHHEEECRQGASGQVRVFHLWADCHGGQGYSPQLLPRIQGGQAASGNVSQPDQSRPQGNVEGALISVKPCLDIDNAQEVFLDSKGSEGSRYIGVVTFDANKRSWLYGFNGFFREAHSRDSAIDALVMRDAQLSTR